MRQIAKVRGTGSNPFLLLVDMIWTDNTFQAIGEVEQIVKEVRPNILVCSPLPVVGSRKLYNLLLHCSVTHPAAEKRSLISFKFCASMWTPEESTRIIETARAIVPDIKTHALPQGFQVSKGPEAVVDYLLEEIPKLLG